MSRCIVYISKALHLDFGCALGLTGIHKREYWKPTLEDALTLIARLPRVAGACLPFMPFLFHTSPLPVELHVLRTVLHC